MSDILTPFPHRIGDWAIDHVLGRGAMAVVFAARDADGRKAALKLATGLDDTARERFRREVEACSRLEHPGIVRILAVGEHDGQPWYAMEWVGAATLADLLSGNSDPYPNDLPALIAACERQALPPVPLARRRLLPTAVSLRLVGDLCLAVAHAHDHGLVHRDLKPANVLLHPDGRPVICDFGLVADLDRQRRLTATGRVLGTVGYSAPELRGRAEVDERVDVYSLGVMLRELLTGQPPALDDPGGAGTTGGRRHDDGLARLPRPLRAIIQRAVHPSSRRRLVSARALHADLQRHLRGERVLSRLDPWPLRLLDLLRRHPWGGGLVLAALVMTVGLLTRTAVLAGLERTRWAMPMADLDLTRPTDLDLLRSAGGAWRGGAEGARPDPDPSGTLLHPRPVFGPIRIEASVRLPAGASLALVLAGDEAGAGGYRLEPAWGGGPWAALLRGDDLLWLGRGPGPGATDLLLEADDGRLRFRLGGTDRSLVDPLPLFGGWCGVRADGGASVQRLVLRGRTVPQARDPAWLAERLVAATVGSPPDTARALLPEALDALTAWERLAPVAHRPRLVLLRSLLAGPGTPLPADLPDIAARDPGLMPALLAGRDPAALCQGLTALAEAWRAVETGSRDRLALVLLALAQRSALAADLAAGVEGKAPSPLAPLRGLLARQVLERVVWRADARRWAVTQIDAAPPGHTAAKATARTALANLGLDDGGSAEEGGWAAIALDRGEPGEAHDRWADLLLARRPDLRFQTDLPEADLPEADRRRLAILRTDLVPPPAAWEVPALADGAVGAVWRAVAAGNRPPADLAWTAARRGFDPDVLPWARLLACRLLIAGRDDDLDACFAPALAGAALDGLAAGLAWTTVLGTPPTPRRRAALGEELQPLYAALAGERPFAGLVVPSWHPGRPLLLLVAAAAAHRAGQVDAARDLAGSLASAPPAWPETAAATALLARWTAAGPTPAPALPGSIAP